MTGVVQPTKGRLISVVVGDVPYYSIVNGVPEANFHVKEFRIFEDICKSYFTGQLVIETLLNVYDHFLYPTAEVILHFECPRTDGGATRAYHERFRVYSYDSKPIGAGADGRVEHTISLIGQEYYNDKHNVVTQNYQNITGIEAARKIHEQYMRSNGGISTFTSKGLIGSERHAHQVMNKKPIKAIHDILDRCVFGQYKTCAPLYFRRKQGYGMGPLQYYLENGSVTGYFKHVIASGGSLEQTLQGYDTIISMRPLAPAGESSSGITAGEISGMQKASSFLDLQSGNIRINEKNFNKLLGSGFLKGIPGAKGKAQEMLAEAQRGKRGAMNMFSVIDETLQKREIDKNGPGGYKQAQEALITALTYAQKYWITVPGQTGLNVTCGDRVTAVFPINDKLVEKVLFVPRLIHEYIVTEGKNRQVQHINGKTDLYCVNWQG